MAVLFKSNLPLPLIAEGKVREVYTIPDSTNLLFVATDRVSCYDVVLQTGIPSKGAVLTQMSNHWFAVLTAAIPHLHTHLASSSLPPALQSSPDASLYAQRSVQVRKLEMLPVESIVRGYLSGSAWASYQATGTVNGVRMPAGLQESQKLDQPIWTPSTKAPAGAKDENISAEAARELLGPHADAVEKLSLEVYEAAHAYAAERGILIADTKFEFGRDPEADGGVVLADEVLTPDSSRFWLAAEYEVGRSQDSLDKQFVRDWLVKNDLKGKEDVEIPADIVQKTAERYQEAYKMICGREWGE